MANPDRRCELDDDICRVEARGKPSVIDTLDDPAVLRHDGRESSITLGGISADTIPQRGTIPEEIIQVVRWNTKAARELRCNKRLAAARPAYDVDSRLCHEFLWVFRVSCGYPTSCGRVPGSRASFPLMLTLRPCGLTPCPAGRSVTSLRSFCRVSTGRGRRRSPRAAPPAARPRDTRTVDRYIWGPPTPNPEEPIL
jgi:hypothetical protein